MRTLDYLPPEKQRAIAQETLDIYAPLAHRLGIARVKSELEDLALKRSTRRCTTSSSGRWRSAGRARGVDRRGHHDPLDEAGRGRDRRADHRPAEALLLDLQEDAGGAGVRPDLRPHRVPRPRRTVRECYDALGVVHSLWKPVPGRFKDFIAMPKPNMYQSLHTTVIGPEGRAHRDPDPHARDAPHRRGGHRRALALQGEEGPHRARPGLRLAAAAPRVAAGAEGPAGVHGDGQGRPVRGRGLRLHAEGRRQGAARGRDADRLRLRDPHRGRQPLRRRAREREARAAPLRAAQGRHRRDRHVARPRSRRATGSRSSRRRAPGRRSSSGSGPRSAPARSRSAASSSTARRGSTASRWPRSSRPRSSGSSPSSTGTRRWTTSSPASATASWRPPPW